MSTAHHARVSHAEKKKQLNAQTQNLAATLQAAHAEVRALRLQLEHAQRLATLGMMAAMVAHEFNNILTPVINYAQMALKSPKHVEKALAFAKDGGLRATAICNGLLGFATDTPPSDENVLDLVNGTLTAMARDFGKDSIELTLDIPAELTLRTRRSEVQQVVANLLLNARDALISRSGGERWIRVVARREAAAVTLSVADSGPGVPREHHKRIFEPLFSTKSPDDATTTGGHGLGLPFCKTIITALGGTISLQSPPSRGATFIVRLLDL